MAEWEEKALEKCVLKPSVYWRFLDDIFMIWEHSKEDFYKFVKILNTHHPSITVKAELSSESKHFSDTVAYKGKRFKETGTFDTKVYFKPTDTLELLHKKSHHPNHTFKGLIKAAKLVKTSFNKLKAKHPNILYKRCVTAFKRGQNLRDLLVRSRLGKAPLDNPTVTGFDSSQDLTTLVNALDEV